MLRKGSLGLGLFMMTMALIVSITAGVATSGIIAIVLLPLGIYYGYDIRSLVLVVGPSVSLAVLLVITVGYEFGRE